MSTRHGKPRARTTARAGGQSTVELTFVVTAVVASAVGLSLYLRNAASARIKAGAEALSPFLADPQRVAGASIRCQRYTELQDAVGGRGRMNTTYAEASQERSGDPATVAPLTGCPPLPPEPVIR